MENFGFDLDGVLHNFVGPAYDYAVKHYGVTQDFYTFWRDADKMFSKERWDEFLSVPDLYLTSKALPEDVETVWVISSKYRLHYITNRPPAVLDATIFWLNKEGFPWENTSFDLLQGSKRPIFEKVNLKYYVEDRLHNAEQIKDLTTVIIKRTPWNRNARGYKEISRIPELLEIV